MGRIVDVVQGTPEWHEFRRLGLGGSDAPVVEELSPYRTMLDLYLEKRGENTAEEGDGNEFIFAKGHKVEGLIRSEFQLLVKAELNPVCMIHNELDHVRASLDGFHPKHGVLEAKFVGQEAIQQAREGSLPADHYSQMQHQFAVSGADVGTWYGHDGKKTGILLEVRRNEEYIKRLLEKEFLFWERVKTGNKPPLSKRDYLKPEDESLLKELRDAKEFAENAAEQYEKIKGHVINAYGGHPKISGAGIIMYMAEREGTLNLLKVPEIAKAAEAAKNALDPAYIEKFRGKGSTSWTVKVGGK